MGTVIGYMIGFIIICAIIGTLISKDPDEGAKSGAAVGGYIILSILPYAIGIVFIILIVRACT